MGFLEKSFLALNIYNHSLREWLPYRSKVSVKFFEAAKDTP